MKLIASLLSLNKSSIQKFKHVRLPKSLINSESNVTFLMQADGILTPLVNSYNELCSWLDIHHLSPITYSGCNQFDYFVSSCLISLQ